MTYLQSILDEPTPQSEALDERQVQNSAGGYVYQVDDESRLMRFLVLGSEGGSYYASERKLTKDNFEAVKRLVNAKGVEAVDIIKQVSVSGRAPKFGPALFVLAVAASVEDEETRKRAFEVLPEVARTGSHLHQFIQFVSSMRGWGRGLRSAVANWYFSQGADRAAYQVVKYRSRYDWSHRDLLRKSHANTPVAAFDELFAWVTQGTIPRESALEIVRVFEQAKTADTDTLVQLIRDHHLSWEMVPEQSLQEARVWEALAEDMPLVAFIRNLATLTRYGVIAPMKCGEAVIKLDKIGREGSPRVHPIQVLSALMTYRAGKGQRGQNTWEPVAQVVEALDDAFDRSFEQAPQTNQRLYLAVDVSGSMCVGEVAGVPGLSPLMGAMAMAMAVVRREPNYVLRAFSGGGFDRTNAQLVHLDVTAKDNLVDAMRKGVDLPHGSTDCSLPMLDALKHKIPVDCFVVLTDSETWSGRVHPVEALRQYRQQMGIPAKLVVVGMVANEFTIADPEDTGMMDVVGFDTSVPRLIADFVDAGSSGNRVVS